MTFAQLVYPEGDEIGYALVTVWHVPTWFGPSKSIKLEYRCLLDTTVTKLVTAMNGSNDKSLPRLFYSVEEVASMLNVSTKTVYRLVDRRLLKTSKAIRHLRITAASLTEFTASTSN